MMRFRWLQRWRMHFLSHSSFNWGWSDTWQCSLCASFGKESRNKKRKFYGWAACEGVEIHTQKGRGNRDYNGYNEQCTPTWCECHIFWTLVSGCWTEMQFHLIRQQFIDRRRKDVEIWYLRSDMHVKVTSTTFKEKQDLVPSLSSLHEVTNSHNLPWAR